MRQLTERMLKKECFSHPSIAKILQKKIESLRKRSHLKFKSFNFFTEKELQEVFKRKAPSSFGEGYKVREYMRLTFDDYDSLQFVDLE